MERHRVWFSGRVQGVGFRATARQAARGHAVSGWVRNEADGRVVLEVQGEGAEVERYLQDLRERMAGNVRGEVREEAVVEGGERGFEIRF